MIELSIITRCTRQNNLLKIAESVFNTDLFKIDWYILFDINIVTDIDNDIVSSLNEMGVHIKYMHGEKNAYGYNMVNDIISSITSGWIYILDDDNIIHPDFYIELNKCIDDKFGIYVFNQDVSGIDFTGLDIRYAKSENMYIGGVDVAQILVNKYMFDEYKFGNSYAGDGEYITNLYKSCADKFFFIDKVLCYYNYFDIIKIKSNYSLPRILLIGVKDKVELFSNQLFDYESNKLNVRQYDTDDNIDIIIQEFKPDSIITVGDSFTDFPNLSIMHYDVRRRWIHLNKLEDNTGDIAYKCAMNSILTNNSHSDNNPLISVFSPIYNTGEKLYRTYESLKKQTYNNWEWVMVNDSNDDGKTLKIAEELALKDSRLKVYDFKVKSGGIIGESKKRSASLCSGEYLLELDHDDYLLPDALYWVVESFKRHPECKFVYSDCAEVWEHNNESIDYGSGFCFGYGSYYNVDWNGVTYKVMNTANINPKTIRHIVGVPNHFRCWETKFYFSIGGHNRGLSIADDYELLVRTFLKTRMLRIPKFLYIQYYHNSNTQNQTRADIQRRVRTISNYYNNDINKRFIELGLKDWAYDNNYENPLYCESKFGIEESVANYILNDEHVINVFDTSSYSNALNYRL